MNHTFNFSNYHNAPPPSSLPPLAWLDPRLGSDREHELLFNAPDASIGTGNKQSSGHIAVHSTASSDLSAAPSQIRTLVTQEQLSSHTFLLAHSPQYLGLFQAYIEASSELRALKTYSISRNTGRRSSLPSRTNSITQARSTQQPISKTTPLPTTISLPLLKKEDYPDEVFWTSKAWSTSAKARKNISEKVSLYDFLRDENGLPPSDEAIEAMRDAFKQACCRLELAGLRPRKWKRCVPEAVKYIQDTLSAAFPLFRYANSDWKVKKFGSRVYPDWNRNYETDSDSDVTPKKRKSTADSDSSQSDSDSEKKKSKHKKKQKQAAPTKMGNKKVSSTKTSSKPVPLPPPAVPPISATAAAQLSAVPLDVVMTPSTTNTPEPSHSLVASLPVSPPVIIDSITNVPEPHSAVASLDSLPPSPPVMIVPPMIAPHTDSPSVPPTISDVSDVVAHSPDPNTNTTAPIDDTIINIVDPMPPASNPHGHRSRRITRGAKANNRPNPLSGLSIPKPTTEVAHSETAPEVRTRGGSKVMEPHPTHLSAKNMFAHEMKKKNAEITQDEFNMLYEKLTPNEKKTYEKLGKARRAELKKNESASAPTDE